MMFFSCLFAIEAIDCTLCCWWWTVDYHDGPEMERDACFCLVQRFYDAVPARIGISPGGRGRWLQNEDARFIFIKGYGASRSCQNGAADDHKKLQFARGEYGVSVRKPRARAPAKMAGTPKPSGGGVSATARNGAFGGTINVDKSRFHRKTADDPRGADRFPVFCRSRHQEPPPERRRTQIA